MQEESSSYVSGPPLQLSSSEAYNTRVCFVECDPNALALTPFLPMSPAILASEEKALLTTGMLNRRIHPPSDFSCSVGVDAEGSWCCASIPTRVRYCRGGGGFGCNTRDCGLCRGRYKFVRNRSPSNTYRLRIFDSTPNLNERSCSQARYGISLRKLTDIQLLSRQTVYL